MKAFFGHLRNILVYKWWVFYYACKFGIPYIEIENTEFDYGHNVNYNERDT